MVVGLRILLIRSATTFHSVVAAFWWYDSRDGGWPGLFAAVGLPRRFGKGLFEDENVHAIEWPLPRLS